MYQSLTKRTCAIVLALVVLGIDCRLASGADLPAVRAGVCPTCTNEGVLGLIFRQTNIAELIGVKLDVLFINPPQMGEGIASKSLDVEWVGDQPTLAQLANGIPIKILGFQFDFELRIESMPPIKSIADLKGKKVGTPFGTTAYQLASTTLAEAGLPASSLVNVAPADLATALAGGQIAAASIWDPLWGIIEKTHKTTPLVKVLHSGFVCVRSAFLESNREAVIKFLQAQILAMVFRANNHAEADRRYEAAFGIPIEAARAAGELDRSYNWKMLDQVNLDLTPKDYQGLADTQAFALKAKLIPREVDLKAAVDISVWKEALQRLRTSGISVSQVRYVTNAK